MNKCISAIKSVLSSRGGDKSNMSLSESELKINAARIFSSPAFPVVGVTNYTGMSYGQWLIGQMATIPIPYTAPDLIRDAMGICRALAEHNAYGK